MALRRFYFCSSNAMDCKRILRLLVAFLVVLAGAKLFFHSRRTEIGEYANIKKYVTMPGHFWLPERTAGRSNLLVPPTRKKNKEKSGDQKTAIHPKLEVKSSVKFPVKMYTGPLRVVHLDLKGAAPKVSYFQQIFPLISSLGADGILVEYEDMFPYEGDLEVLRSPFAYSVDEIEEIKNLASLYNLELIPLVQVFGHLEFVLKHGQFFNLREVADFPNSLNPLVPGSLKLVKEMLTQVLKKHPQARWFHIGADEVYGLGESADSKKWMKQNNGSVAALFLSHVTKVCHILAELKPGIKPIFWEDMLRKISATLLKESGLSSLASPMIWKYNANMNLVQIGELLSNYQQAGFQNVWFASAFKGASGIDQRWTPLNHHLENHLAWLKVMASMSKYPSIKLDGIVLTGWQRYEHHTVLCELLPVAIPSLAICLETLKYGSFNRTAETEVQRHLGCKVDLKANSCQGNGSFAGSQVYYMVQKIHNELRKSTEEMTQNYHLRGSFGPYQRKYNFANPRNIGYFKGVLIKLMNEWDHFMEMFRMEMLVVYFPDTVEEWMEENVNQYMDKLHSLAKDVEHIVKLKGQPKSLKTV
ncbi:beta-N-acetylhexosaminidase isoform X2 [Pangasianodon hypophthalmus]|uniref:beta-N-acetylhexosaminidase isoform X2 n=1 Tax=Pangasianodon hypophthalmus TaxID=310915 RepID=UPI0023083241|nr:beta-N-acetylhexosaminidase isoform X2 [Pangasianodon hypophthalmus]